MAVNKKHKGFHFPALMVCFVLYLFGLRGTTNAQQAKISYPYKLYTIQDGLVQMQVQCLFQDSKGYLWCGTKTGISRFDGSNFKNYSGINIGQDGPVCLISENEKGNIFVFNKYNFSIIKNDSIQNKSYPKDVVMPENGAIIQPAKTKFLQVDLMPEGKIDKTALLFYNKPDSLYIHRLNTDYDKKISYFDEKYPDLSWRKRNDTLFVVDNHTEKARHAYQSHGITKLKRRSDDLYGFASHKGIYKLEGNHFQLVCPYDLPYINKVLLTPDRQSFVISTESDLYIYTIGKTIKLIKSDLTLIRDLLFDYENNLWVATEEGLYNFFQLDFVNYTFGMGNKDWVWSVVEDHQQNMWFTSYQNGIWSWDGNNITSYNDLPLFKQAYFYMGAYKHAHTLYFPAREYLFRYNGKQFSRVEGVPRLNAEAYFFVEKTSDGDLYCGGMDGLIRKTKRGTITHWANETLGISTVLSIEFESAYNICLFGKNGIVRLKNDSIVYRKMLNHNLYCSTKDQHDNIWIGGNEKLYRLKNDSITDVLPQTDEQFYSLLFYPPHYLFLGGLKGLYIADLKEYEQTGVFDMQLYNQNNGFTGIESAQNAFFMDSKGFVWLPTSDLVVRFDPEKLINKQTKIPKLKVSTSISKDNIHWHDLTLNNRRLKAQENNIRFTMNTVSFSDAGVFRYYHRLKGLQGEWSTPSTSNVISFYHLAPGNYQLMVKADPGITKAMTEPVVIDFEIKKPFWLRWWFILLLTGVIIFTIWQIVAYFQRVERKKSYTEHRLTQLRSEALSAQLDPHFVMNCLNNISGLIGAGERELANDYIVKFSKLLRLILQSVKKEHITLEEELDIVKKYMDLEQFRCNNCFQYNIHTPKKFQVETILVPPMILQPFVENSIKHGFRSLTERRAKINISVEIHKQMLHFIILDNGKGIQSSTPVGTGIGTNITRERIELLKKKTDMVLDIKNTHPGVKVSFDIPLVINN